MNDGDFKRIEDMMVRVVTDATIPIYKRLDRHENLLHGHDKKFDNIKAKLDHISKVVDEHSEAIVELDAKVTDLQGDIVIVKDDVKSIKSHLEVSDKRVQRIEESFSVLKEKDNKGYNPTT